jgi:hypothetical protein
MAFLFQNLPPFLVGVLETAKEEKTLSFLEISHGNV